MIVGITVNPFSKNVSTALIAACKKLGIPYRTIDLNTTTMTIAPGASVQDKDGTIEVTHITPTLVYWQDQAALGLAYLQNQRNVLSLNTMAATETADDKATTALALLEAQIPQVPTIITGMNEGEVVSAALAYGFPVVIKRTHGAQGRFVRLARTSKELHQAYTELADEGNGAIIVQPVGSERLGESVRVIVTAGTVRAATVRHAVGDEWRSNIARGGFQEKTDISDLETSFAVAAAQAVGLGHAGIDILRSENGPVVLEVNSCPDFTSMIPYTDVDLAAIVVEETIKLKHS